jgi:hypothetical protein
MVGSKGGTGPLDCPKRTIMPRGRRQLSDLSNVVFPTLSYTTLTPRPAVICFTSLSKSCSV